MPERINEYPLAMGMIDNTNSRTIQVLLPYLADKCEKFYDRLKNDTQMVK
jgi:hypothetical protein